MGNEYFEFTPNQQRALAIAPKPSATLSFLASTILIVSVLRNPTKRRKVYHRLILGLSIISLIQSVNFFLGTWPIPKDAPGFYGAAGTVGTCTAQGFILQFGFVAPFYYASLSLYAFLAVRNDFKEERIAWIEKYIHVGVFAVPLATAISLLNKEMLNPTGPWCWIESYPMGCKGDQCIRGTDDLQSIGMYFAGIPMLIFIGFATLMMILLYWTERKRSFKVMSSTVSGKKRFLEEARRKKSRLVARQASFYLAAFYLTYSISVIANLIKFYTGETHFPTFIIGNCFVPLQGFFTMIVYFRLQLRRKPPKRRRSSLVRAAQCLALHSITTASFALPPKKESSKATLDQTADPDREEEEFSREQFSIFDGTNPSSRWKEFIYDEDYDDEDEDECDEGNDSHTPPSSAETSPKEDMA